MRTLCVAFSDVRLGDRIYNKYAYHPAAAWLEVIETTAFLGYIHLKTQIYSTYGHPREGITIQRIMNEKAAQDADYQAREAEQIRQSLARVNARIKVRELAERVKARESAHRR